MSPRSNPPRARAKALRASIKAYGHRANLLTSLLLVFPLFLAYQLAVVALPDAHNGADLVTGTLLRLAGGSGNYLLVNLALVVGFVVLLAVMARRQSFHVRLFVPVIVESGVYALTMGALICSVMGMIGIDPSLRVAAGHAAPAVADPKTLSLASRVAIALGAGVHEELVFRLAMIPSLTWLFEKGGGVRRGLAIAGAFVVSSLLFSAAHHVIGGEPWHVGVFTYRFFCGLVFASLFQFRGLAVAVYTHALYDIYVMLFAG